MQRQWRLEDPSHTARLGAAVAGACRWDENSPRLLYLAGELGSGKTFFAAALLAALGAQETVRSPSYALMETYRLRDAVALHLDCYRLHAPQELEQLGLRDYFTGGTLWLVEWPERAGQALPPPDLMLTLSVAGAARDASLRAVSAAGLDWLGRIVRAIPSQS